MILSAYQNPPYDFSLLEIPNQLDLMAMWQIARAMRKAIPVGTQPEVAKAPLILGGGSPPILYGKAQLDRSVSCRPTTAFSDLDGSCLISVQASNSLACSRLKIGSSTRTTPHS
jgi:hypothetical protein